MLPSVETKPATSRKLRVALRDADALLLHLDRQQRRGQREFVLHLDLRGVRVGALLERQRDFHAAVFVACGREVPQMVEAAELLLDDLDDGALHGLGRGAGIRHADRDQRRRDRRILRDRQREGRQPARQHDDDRDHPGEDRAIDEEVDHQRTPAAGAWATRAARHSTGRTVSAGLDLLSALHDHALAGLDAVADQPPIANRAGRLQRPLLDFVLAIDDERHGLTACVVRDTLLRDEQPFVVDGLRDERAHVHARQQEAIRIREPRPQPDHAGGFIDRDVGEGQHARVLVFAAVVEPQSDLDRALPARRRRPLASCRCSARSWSLDCVMST